MTNTFTQIYIHVVFAVNNRHNLIPKQFKDDLHKYIAGIFQNKKHKLLCINSMPDHVHILFASNPQVSLSDIVRDIKANSSRFINERKWAIGTFHWQEGYGAFSYSHSQIDSVIRYIKNQERHHSRKTFKEEYLEMLKKFGIECEGAYLKFIEDES